MLSSSIKLLGKKEPTCHKVIINPLFFTTFKTSGSSWELRDFYICFFLLNYFFKQSYKSPEPKVFGLKANFLRWPPTSDLEKLLKMYNLFMLFFISLFTSKFNWKIVIWVLLLKRVFFKNWSRSQSQIWLFLIQKNFRKTMKTPAAWPSLELRDLDLVFSLGKKESLVVGSIGKLKHKNIIKF